MDMKLELKQKYKKSELGDFAEQIKIISRRVGLKISSRGWCYILEGFRFINKDEFDKVEVLINNCRKHGFLPIDFVAEESARQFEGIETPDTLNVVKKFGRFLRHTMDTPDMYTPDWWEGEECYIQMVVEKVDLVTLFRPICEKYHIPIANSRGWSSMLQRAEYARRFGEAEDKGLTCVLLYCGDHDPDGLRISDFIRKNLNDLKDVRWANGTDGYNPSNLIVDRFGLNYDFIQRNNLTWIDNLITSGKKIDLGSPAHPNHFQPYVQNYLKQFGRRKCEANAILTHPREAADLCTNAIEKYIGTDALERFELKELAVREEFDSFLDDNEIRPEIDKTFKLINDY